MTAVVWEETSPQPHRKTNTENKQPKVAFANKTIKKEINFDKNTLLEFDYKDVDFENEKLVEEKYNLQNDITVCASAVENSNNRIDQIDKELHKVISNIDDKRNIKNEITNEKNEIETQAKSDLTELEKSEILR